MTAFYTDHDLQYLRRRQTEVEGQASTLYPCADGIMRTAGDKAAWEQEQQSLTWVTGQSKDW